MNTVSRIVTGLVIIVLSILFIITFGFLNDDSGNIVFGFFFLIIGIFILFNKKEDEIEKIKKEK